MFQVGEGTIVPLGRSMALLLGTDFMGFCSCVDDIGQRADGELGEQVGIARRKTGCTLPRPILQQKSTCKGACSFSMQATPQIPAPGLVLCSTAPETPAGLTRALAELLAGAQLCVL